MPLAVLAAFAQDLDGPNGVLPPVSSPDRYRTRMDVADDLLKASVNGGAWTPFVFAAGGVVSMQNAYDGGGALGSGAGRAIATMTGGAVTMLNAVADATNCLELTRNGAASGGCLTLTTAAAGTGSPLVITRGASVAAFNVNSAALVVNQQSQRHPAGVFILRNLSKTFGLAEYWDTVGDPYVLDGATTMLYLDGQGDGVTTGTVDASTNNVQFRCAHLLVPTTTDAGTRGLLVASTQRAGAGVEAAVTQTAGSPDGFLATMAAQSTNASYGYRYARTITPTGGTTFTGGGLVVTNTPGNVASTENGVLVAITHTSGALATDTTTGLSISMTPGASAAISGFLLTMGANANANAIPFRITDNDTSTATTCMTADFNRDLGANQRRRVQINGQLGSVGGNATLGGTISCSRADDGQATNFITACAQPNDDFLFGDISGTSYLRFLCGSGVSGFSFYNFGQASVGSSAATATASARPANPVFQINTAGTSGVIHNCMNDNSGAVGNFAGTVHAIQFMPTGTTTLTGATTGLSVNLRTTVTPGAVYVNGATFTLPASTRPDTSGEAALVVDSQATLGRAMEFRVRNVSCASGLLVLNYGPGAAVPLTGTLIGLNLDLTTSVTPGAQPITAWYTTVAATTAADAVLQGCLVMDSRATAARAIECAIRNTSLATGAWVLRYGANTTTTGAATLVAVVPGSSNTLTLGAALTGITVNLSSNVTHANNQVRGLDVTVPATSNTSSYGVFVTSAQTGGAGIGFGTGGAWTATVPEIIGPSDVDFFVMAGGTLRDLVLGTNGVARLVFDQTGGITVGATAVSAASGQVAWATGFGAITQILGPTDQPLAYSAGTPAAGAAGNGLSFTATSGSANGVNGTAGGQVRWDTGSGGTATTGTAGNAGAFVWALGTGGTASGAAGIGGTGGSSTWSGGGGGSSSSATGGNGGAGGTMVWTFGAGGPTAGTGSTGGAGGGPTWTCGAGGASTHVAAGTGGAGGGVTGVAGAGGASTAGTGGAGGDIAWTLGKGGAGVTGGRGGIFSVTFPTVTGAGAQAAFRVILSDASNIINATNANALTLGAAGGTLAFLGGTPIARPAAYAITNGAIRRTFDTTTVTLSQLAEVVSTILSDFGDTVPGYNLFDTNF